MENRITSVTMQIIGVRCLHFLVIIAMLLPNGLIFTKPVKAATHKQAALETPQSFEPDVIEVTPAETLEAGETISPTITITTTETVSPTQVISPTFEPPTHTPTVSPTEEFIKPTPTLTVTEEIPTPTITLTPAVTITPTETVTSNPTITATQNITASDVFTSSDKAAALLPSTGGKVIGFNGAVTVTFPTQTEKLAVWVRSPSEENMPPFSLSGNPIEIIAYGQDSKRAITKFTSPITITVSYDPQSLWGDESGLSLYYYDQEIKDWNNIPSYVDTKHHEIIGFSDHLTVFDYQIETWQSARLPTIEGFQVAEQTGAGSYSMDLWTPPGPGGLQPELTLSYNSQVVDSALKQTQASWVGMGWTLDTGYIERNTYGTDYLINDDTFSIVIGGVSGMLLPDSANDGIYHIADENF